MASELSGNLYEYNYEKSKKGKENFYSLDNSKLSCYGKKKDYTARKEPKYSLEIRELTNITIDKSKHDNILCIRNDEKTIFLIATKKEDINQWYSALCKLFHIESEVKLRQRSNTERYDRKQVQIGKNTISGPSLGGFLGNALNNERRPLPAVPENQEQSTKSSDANADNINFQVLSELPCCIRHHMMQKHNDGRNMVDTDTNYENIHFVRGVQEWQRKTEDSKFKLKNNNESYDLANKLKTIQTNTNSSEKQNHYELSVGLPVSNVNAAEDDPIYQNTPRKLPEENRQSWHIAVSPPPLPEKKKRPVVPPTIAPKPKNKSDKSSSLKSVRVYNEYVRSPLLSEKNQPVPPKIAPKPMKKCNNSDEPSSLRSFSRASTKYNVSGDYVREQGKSKTTSVSKQELVRRGIKLAEINNGIWFGGFENSLEEENAEDTPHWLMFGDQLIQINDQWLDSAKFADNIINTTTKQEVSLCVKRLPHAQIIPLTRQHSGQDLGLECHSREVTNVAPDHLASTQGRLRPEATGIMGMNCTWTITHVNSEEIPQNITTEMMEEKLQSAGKVVNLIVQPTDFVKTIIEQS
ncbi:uncharacterized protein [Antedon mediterranea]|uniref:uncharacterized protein n=1 Tax=Antedon mediterranea TaxID=105859 RepID=UPI003AF96D88